MFAPLRNEMSRQRIGNGLLQTSAKTRCRAFSPVFCFLSNTNANMQIVKVAWIKANYI